MKTPRVIEGEGPPFEAIKSNSLSSRLLFCAVIGPGIVQLVVGIMCGHAYLLFASSVYLGLMAAAQLHVSARMPLALS